MPFYRLKNGIVHMRGTKLPPPCAAVIEIDGKKARCAVWSAYLCDGPGRDGRTCDMPLCEDHATPIGKNVHLCPEHFLAREVYLAQNGLFTSLVQS